MKIQENVNKQLRKKSENKKASGITLIALVITIIVLIILAGVTIAMLTGENGILTKANKAQTENIVGKEKEEIGLAYSYAKAEKLQKADTSSVTGEELKKGFTENSATNVALEGNNPIKVTFSNTKNVYEIDNSGNITGPKQGDNPVDNKPYLPAGATVIESDVSKGYTIKDSNSNEWVWVEVPKTIYTTATGKTDYAKIETDMQEYAGAYRGDYTDTWYEGCGLTESEYNKIKIAMLESVYTNGGFYIGRYEVGTEMQRKTKGDVLSTAVIKQDMYPYNFVTCSQSQLLAKELTIGGKTSSLIFGIQWDLVCKFMEEKGSELGLTTVDRQTKIKIDSSSWGNYNNVSFNINRGQYSTDDGIVFVAASEGTIKPSSKILLTTGASERNKVLNIYDFAGNELEWTLENSSVSSIPCANRGGYYNNSGFDFQSYGRYGVNITVSDIRIAFRAVLY